MRCRVIYLETLVVMISVLACTSTRNAHADGGVSASASEDAQRPPPPPPPPPAPPEDACLTLRAPTAGYHWALVRLVGVDGPILHELSRTPVSPMHGVHVRRGADEEWLPRVREGFCLEVPLAGARIPMVTDFIGFFNYESELRFPADGVERWVATRPLSPDQSAIELRVMDNSGRPLPVPSDPAGATAYARNVGLALAARPQLSDEEIERVVRATNLPAEQTRVMRQEILVQRLGNQRPTSNFTRDPRFRALPPTLRLQLERDRANLLQLREQDLRRDLQPIARQQPSRVGVRTLPALGPQRVLAAPR